ncbi:MAG: RagB/SusD family nutrient uptake outer membrane protein [Muribaculaceae bacterium]|nr:RagB/SusD family nutrient uptake outer membrane protein [Muribaculaceae bacterium]
MKLRYLTIVAGLLLLSLPSCKDFLDAAPDTRVELVTVKQLRELLVTGYMQYNYAIVGELSSDNVIDNNSPDENGKRYNLTAYDLGDEELYAWNDVKSNISSDSPSTIWSGCYHAIATANAVLERVAELEADPSGLSDSELETLSAVKGEALLIRAYHHFILVNFFCMPYQGDNPVTVNGRTVDYQGIPYMTKPETEVKPHYDRGTVADDYRMIEADIEAGVPLINDAIYESPKYHFNRAAANAFAARFYLFKRDYEKVVKYADAAFNGVDPSEMMSDIWAHRGEMYYISDIGRYYTSTSRANVFLCMSSYSTWARRNHGYRFQCHREAKRATIEGPGPTWKNCKWRNTQTNEVFSMHPCFNGLCGTAGSSEYGKYFGGILAEQFEYTDKLAGIGYAHMVRAEFTAEETLLCRAEAKLFLGDRQGCFNDLKIWDDSKQKIGEENSGLQELTPDLIELFYSPNDEGRKWGIMKEVRIDEVCPSDKYHLTDDMKAFMQCIQHYRRIETIHTGMRWFDIKRYGMSFSHKMGQSEIIRLEFMDPRYAIQIPSEVISAGFDVNPRPEKTSGGEATVISSKVIVPVK